MSSAGTDDDRINAIAQVMDPGTRSLSADPVRVPRPRGDLAIERHSPLRCNIRATKRNERSKRTDQRVRLLLLNATFDLYACFLQLCETLAIDARIGV